MHIGNCKYAISVNRGSELAITSADCEAGSWLDDVSPSTPPESIIYKHVNKGLYLRSHILSLTPKGYSTVATRIVKPWELYSVYKPEISVVLVYTVWCSRVPAWGVQEAWLNQAWSMQSMLHKVFSVHV